MRIEAAESTGRKECQFVIFPETEVEKIVCRQFLEEYKNRKNKMIVHGQCYQMGTGFMSFNFGLSDHDHRYKANFWYRIAQKLMNIFA